MKNNKFVSKEKRIYSILVFVCFITLTVFLFIFGFESYSESEYSDIDDNQNDNQKTQELNKDFYPYEIKSASGEDYIILRGSAEYLSLMQSNVIGNNPVIVVGDKGKLNINGIDTNIITNKSFIYDEDPCVMFIVLEETGEKVDTYSIKMNDEVSKFELDKTNNEIKTSNKELNVFIGDNGNWYVNGVDTLLKADGTNTTIINNDSIDNKNKNNSRYDIDNQNDIHQDNPDNVAKLDNVKDSNIANSKQELDLLRGALIDSSNIPSFTIKDSYRSSGWYCDDILVLLTQDQVYGDKVISYFENMNRASDEQDLFKSDNVWETNMNLTDLFKATGPRYHDRK